MLEMQTTQPQPGGLGYSRHYAQRIRDLGQTSKDSWIKRLWNHMFGPGSASGKKVVVKGEDGACGGNVSRKTVDRVDSMSARRSSDHVDLGGRKTSDHSDSRCLLADSTSHGHHAETADVKKLHQTSNYDKHEAVAPSVPRQTKSSHELAGKTMPPQLLNSPYLPSKEKVVYYRPTLTAKSNNNTHDGIVAAKLRYQRLSKSSTMLRSWTGGYLERHEDVHKPICFYKPDDVNHRPSCVLTVKRQYKRDSAVIQMEKRAKVVADRAIMVCINIY